MQASRRKRIRALLAIAVVLVLLPGVANAACQPSRTNNGTSYLVGWYRNAPSGQDAEAVTTLMSEYDPWVLYASASQSVAWIGLFQDSGNYAINGWFVKLLSVGGTRQRWDFTEERENSGTPSRWSVNQREAALGTAQVRTVFYEAPAVYFYVAGQEVNSVLTDMVPVQGRNFSGITTYSNQMPGSTSVNQTYQSTLIRFNGSYGAFSGSASNPNYSIWGLSLPAGGTEAKTWETNCTV